MIANYRIATDSRPDWKVRARTHGAIRTKTLTVQTQNGTVPVGTWRDAHKFAAERLAAKIAPGATVMLHSSDGLGRADWAVVLPD